MSCIGYLLSASQIEEDGVEVAYTVGRYGMFDLVPVPVMSDLGGFVVPAP